MRGKRPWVPRIVLALVIAGSLATTSSAARGFIIFAVGAEAQSLDVHNTRANSDEMVAWHIFETLVTRNNPNLEIKPGLAKSWTTSRDGLVWTFELKRGVKFHDGTPFNAQAVKYNFDRLLDPKTPTIKSGVFAFIDRVEAVGGHTVRMTTKFPFGATLAHLAHPGGGIASPAALERYGAQFGQNPVGTGPFKLKQWIVGNRIVLERFNDYHGGSPALREIIFRTAREDATRVMMLETGEADVAVNIPPHEAERLKLKKSPALQVHRVQTNRVIYIGINTQVPPLDNPKVRQALNHAVDKEAIVKHILNGYGDVSDSVLAPLTWGYVPGKKYEYSPDKARQLLREAGALGTRLKLWTPQGRYLKDAEIAQAVQGYLAAVGLNIDFQVMEWGAFVSTITVPPDKAQHHLYLMGASPSTADADWLMRALVVSTALPPVGYNSFYYMNPRVDGLVAQAQRTVAPAERLALYGRAQEIIRDEAPWIFLTIMENVVVAKKNLYGLIVSPLEYVFAYEAYFK